MMMPQNNTRATTNVLQVTRTALIVLVVRGITVAT
jgi:hypothetical protein